MKKIKSIGLIETLGMVGAVEAADAALKAANVSLLGYEFNGGGYVVVKLTGDVAAVQAAISSGGATADRLGHLVATHVMPRPDEQVIEKTIKTPGNVPSFDPPENFDPPETKAPAVKPADTPKVKPEAAKTTTQAQPAQAKPTPKPEPKPAPKPVAKKPEPKKPESGTPQSKPPVKPTGKSDPKSTGKPRPKGKK